MQQFKGRIRQQSQRLTENKYMPFESKAQAKYMFATDPKLAKEFAKKTIDMKNMPEHKKEMKPMKPKMM